MAKQENKVSLPVQKIEKFFARRPDLKQAYMTSDTTIFLKVKNAESHAKSLENKKVQTIKRT